ncbi:hypothetical protein BH10ACT3_BH10ACT3_03240 [soil metagenome]
MTKPDAQRVKNAQVIGAVAGLRDAVVLADPELLARHRQEWPQFWDRVDRLVDLE